MKKIFILFLVCVLVASPASSQGLLKTLGTLGKAVGSSVTGYEKGKGVRIKDKKSKKDKSSKGTESANDNSDTTITNKNDEIVLTVSADGATKEEATKLALSLQDSQNNEIALTASVKGTTAITDKNDEIALTVSADGATKEEAIKVALRNAIEQAYGTFVSANTTILSDDVVKDEIVTISNGNIKGYEEVASVLLPNGRTTVTLKAVVCISKLISYAQSKGATTEFAGATFGMNMKMKELNKKNEQIALNNLFEQIKVLLPTAFERRLVVKEPKNATSKEFFDNENFDYDIGGSIGEYYIRGYNRLKPTKSELFFAQNIKQMYNNINNYYILTLELSFEENKNTAQFLKLIESTLKNLSLSDSEISEYKDLALPTSEIPIRIHLGAEIGITSAVGYFINTKPYRFRSSQKDAFIWLRRFVELMNKDFSDFVIVDNTGTVSSFESYKFVDACSKFKSKFDYANYETKGTAWDLPKKDFNTNRASIADEWYFRDTRYVGFTSWCCNYDNDMRGHYYVMTGKGIFSPFVKTNINFRNKYNYIVSEIVDGKDYPFAIGEYEFNGFYGYIINKTPIWIMKVLIPKSEISKYSSFTVERKNK